MIVRLISNAELEPTGITVGFHLTEGADDPLVLNSVFVGRVE